MKCRNVKFLFDFLESEKTSRFFEKCCKSFDGGVVITSKNKCEKAVRKNGSKRSESCEKIYLYKEHKANLFKLKRSPPSEKGHMLPYYNF